VSEQEIFQQWVCANTPLTHSVQCRAVEDLLLWRDPKKSGVVLAGATLAYLLLEWSHFSLLSIVANTLLVAVSVAFLWNNIANFTHRCGCFGVFSAPGVCPAAPVRRR
jgi:hypothetical protein